MIARMICFIAVLLFVAGCSTPTSADAIPNATPNPVQAVPTAKSDPGAKSVNAEVSTHTNVIKVTFGKSGGKVNIHAFGLIISNGHQADVNDLNGPLAMNQMTPYETNYISACGAVSISVSDSATIEFVNTGTKITIEGAGLVRIDADGSFHLDDHK